MPGPVRPWVAPCEGLLRVCVPGPGGRVWAVLDLGHRWDQGHEGCRQGPVVRPSNGRQAVCPCRFHRARRRPAASGTVQCGISAWRGRERQPNKWLAPYPPLPVQLPGHARPPLRRSSDIVPEWHSLRWLTRFPVPLARSDPSPTKGFFHEPGMPSGSRPPPQPPVHFCHPLLLARIHFAPRARHPSAWSQDGVSKSGSKKRRDHPLA